MREIKRERDTNFNQLILRNINNAIEETQTSKAEIARRLGVNYSTLWKVLHGKLKIKPEYIAEIAHMTYRTPNDFFYSKD